MYNILWKKSEGERYMVSREFTIKNAVGLHMRPAAVFANEMGLFESEVTIVYGDNKVNAKSLLSIIAACIKCGAVITLICEGKDEQAALDKAAELIDSGFGE